MDNLPKIEETQPEYLTWPLDKLEHDIELAKLDNAAFLVSKPGSQMSVRELAENGMRGNILGIMGDSIPAMRVLQRYHDEQRLKV